MWFAKLFLHVAEFRLLISLCHQVHNTHLYGHKQHKSGASFHFSFLFFPFVLSLSDFIFIEILALIMNWEFLCLLSPFAIVLWWILLGEVYYGGIVEVISPMPIIVKQTLKLSLTYGVNSALPISSWWDVSPLFSITFVGDLRVSVIIFLPKPVFLFFNFLHSQCF